MLSLVTYQSIQRRPFASPIQVPNGKASNHPNKLVFSAGDWSQSIDQTLSLLAIIQSPWDFAAAEMVLRQIISPIQPPTPVRNKNSIHAFRPMGCMSSRLSPGIRIHFLAKQRCVTWHGYGSGHAGCATRYSKASFFAFPSFPCQHRIHGDT